MSQEKKTEEWGYYNGEYYGYKKDDMYDYLDDFVHEPVPFVTPEIQRKIDERCAELRNDKEHQARVEEIFKQFGY